MSEANHVRIFFKKFDRAVYISHLDLYRTFQRAFKRSKLPVWETEGFNKHIYLNFVLPLSLGVTGLSEPLDTKFDEELDFSEIKARLDKALPEGLQILKVDKPVMKATLIKSAEYEIVSDVDVAAFREFLSHETILTEKKTKKKGITEIDLKPLIHKSEVTEEKITLVLPAGTELTINPMLVFEAYKRIMDKKYTKLEITRTKIFTENNALFI